MTANTTTQTFDLVDSGPRCYEKICWSSVYPANEEEDQVCAACHAHWLSLMLTGDAEVDVKADPGVPRRVA